MQQSLVAVEAWLKICEKIQNGKVKAPVKTSTISYKTIASTALALSTVVIAAALIQRQAKK